MSITGVNAGTRKTTVSVQNAASKCGQRNEKQIRKREAQHHGGKFEVAAVADKARRYDGHEYRGGNDTNQSNDEQNDREGAGDSINKFACFFMAVFFPIASHYGHESLRKRAFGKKTSQHIRNAICDQEGVHNHGNGEESSQHHVANQAEDSGQQGHGTDHRCGLNQAAARNRPGFGRSFVLRGSVGAVFGTHRGSEFTPEK